MRLTSPELDRPVLTLADLEAFDPRAPAGKPERRFCCPLPACSGKPIDAAHRTLSLNVNTGVWTCYRCGGAGQLREHWQPPAQARQIQLRRAFSLSPDRPIEPQKADPDWQGHLAGAIPIADTQGARYLALRGIRAELATAAGVLYAPAFFNRPAVLFPLRDRTGALVGLSGRYIDQGAPKARTVGRKKLGAFATLGAFKGEPWVITEGPIDALSLAVAGVPAIALDGVSWPDWLPPAAAFKRVAVALDADERGDRAAPKLTAALQRFGANVERWRPIAKDWNEALGRHGVEALKAELLPVARLTWWQRLEAAGIDTGRPAREVEPPR